MPVITAGHLFPAPISSSLFQPALRYFAMWRASSLGRYVFGSVLSYNKAPPRLPGLAYLIAQSRKKSWDIEFQKCFW
jgi:hypothetical protein